ncbi:rare lipoprotein A [Thiohalospira halophila DSM 15071]|uniref:Endolytic peptidoglycan transglycosylase RlpA n=1 Tax=Thiohalospira halophila DSM 15071 TaxID=1123397 RepID=A0A1I1TU04_9GAMM|nr:septal ring lytic transglycosylase RlpA family protein [Thiohalospira halophila]SFD59943.1 rare lipoprotein A [Thiohalospira halophila DSM 15071]
MSTLGRWVVGLAALPLLHACGSLPTEPGDGPPEKTVDVSGVPEPVPRAEPPSRYGNPDSYEVFGETYHVMDSSDGYRERGHASWYGTKFHGQRTSSGEPYDMFALTAAHKSLPLPTYVEVTNLDNGRSLVVKVNDRGPFHEGRIIDLSYAAARRLGVYATGTAPVEVRALNPAADEENPEEGATPEQRPDELMELVQNAGSVGERAEAGPVYLQVGAFREADNATSLRRRLEAADGIGPVAIREEAGIHRVRVGPLDDRGHARRLGQRIADLGLPPPVVVPSR